MEARLTAKDGAPALRSVRDGMRLRAVPLILSGLRRILVVKLDRVGDFVLATPFLRNLRANAPMAMIDLVVREEVLELAAACADVNRVVAVGPDGAFCGRSGADTAAFERDYALGQFELAVVPRWDVDFDGASAIAAKSGAPVVLGFSEACTARKRVLNPGQDRFYTHVLDDFRLVHEVEHNLALIAAMNGVVRDRHVGVEIGNADAARAGQWLSPLPRSRPLLAIAPFSIEPKRCIPIGEAEAIARPVLDELAACAVVVGSEMHRGQAEQLVGRLGARAMSLAGRCGLSEAAAVIRRCDAVIAADSGPAHIAAAVGTPVAVLSCHPQNGRPEHENSPSRFSPWGERSRILVLQPESAVAPCEGACTATEPHCLIEGIRGGKDRLLQFLKEKLEQGRPDRLPRCEPEQFPAG